MAKQQGGGSATMVIAVYLLGFLMLHAADAANYTVGDSMGWTFNISRWTKDKCFKAGDILEFNYSPLHHNVVAVDKEGFRNCRINEGAKVYNSGNDRITMVEGVNYFVCGFLTTAGPELECTSEPDTTTNFAVINNLNSSS